MTEPDPRNSLRHVLAVDPTPGTPNDDNIHAEAEEERVVQRDDTPPPLEDPEAAYSKTQLDPSASAPAGSTVRRNPNGSVSSVYSGNKIRHLKKDDGEPLWRKDIQYDFLRAVFADDRPVFHRISDGSYGYSFADIYLEAMARSTKCSKILKDKLLSDRPAAINMAMVCLLVNVGRMNTTLNCTSVHRPSPTEDHLLIHLHSLSRDESSIAYISLNPFAASSARPKLLQAATRRSKAQVHPQGCNRGV